MKTLTFAVSFTLLALISATVYQMELAPKNNETSINAAKAHLEQQENTSANKQEQLASQRLETKVQDNELVVNESAVDTSSTELHHDERWQRRTTRWAPPPPSGNTQEKHSRHNDLYEREHGHISHSQPTDKGPQPAKKN